MHELAPAADVEPAEQFWQTLCPVAEVYVTASQKRHSEGRKLHGPPSGPLYPALQVHAFFDVLANGEYEFGGHWVHACGVRPMQDGFE
jgi:hypothetical protein